MESESKNLLLDAYEKSYLEFKIKNKSMWRIVSVDLRRNVSREVTTL